MFRALSRYKYLEINQPACVDTHTHRRSADPSKEMTVSQEGGFPVVVVPICTAELFLERDSVSPPPPHIVRSPPVYSAAVLGQRVSHRWLSPSLLLATFSVEISNAF